MRPHVARSALVLLATAVGLATSGALFVDYTRRAPVFCGDGGGCDALRESVYGHPFGVPLPFPGIVAFFVLGMLALSRGSRVRQLNMLIAGAGGVGGLVLLALQAAMGHFCPYCAAVDVSFIVLGVLGVLRNRAGWDPVPGRTTSVIASAGLAASLVAPFGWAHFQSTRVPRVIAEELAHSPPGAVTIVDFVDYECPFCRQTQEKLAPLLAAQKGRVHVVRRLVPLTRIHPHALAAAKAACCGEELGKGEAMSDALFQTKVEDLTPEGCARVAESLGLPLDRYRACVDSAETDARLARDRHEFDQATVKGDGLPLLWIGRYKLMGAQDEATLAETLGEALARAGS